MLIIDLMDAHSIPRRRVCQALLAIAAVPFSAYAQSEPLQIGLTPVFLDDQISFLARWRDWIEHKLKRPVAFVQRGNYREVVDLIRSGKIDFAWICGYPYVRYRNELRLVAVPLWRGQPNYRSYLIVPADDKRSERIDDLRGRIFAYSDPDSNSGYLYPQYRLIAQRENPATFFARTFFTWSHRNVVEAVGVGLADGGAVDGYVWETLTEINPRLTQATRVIDRSPEFGHTPFVARANIDRAKLQLFQSLLLGMAGDPEGAELLRLMRLDGFIAGKPALYESIAQMAAKVR